MADSLYNLDKMCRVCKSECPEMLCVFENDGNNDQGPRIDEMLMACTAVSVNCGDGLPSLICHPCKEQLDIAYIFKQQCETTDTTLREYLNQREIEESNTNHIIKEELTVQAVILKEVNNVEAIILQDSDNNIGEQMSNIKAEPNELEAATCNLEGDFIQFLDNNQLLLTCRTCSKFFTTLDGLKCHKRIHTGSLFKCKECGKQYTRQNHLQRHEMSHGRRKIHVCKICNKTLTRFEHLKRHLITHLKEKPFSCMTCNRGFNRSEHLANHVRRCKGDRVYICDICNKGFNREDSLEVHRKLHENKMPVLPTLENLDNIDQHYLEIDYDGTDDNTFAPFSDASDSEPEADTDCLEPQVNISENTDSVKLLDIPGVANLEGDLYGELDPEDLNDEKSKIQQEFYEDQDSEIVDAFDMKQEPENSDSEHSEYSPSVPTPRVKRKRGRPRKNAVKRPGRPRGRPPLNTIKTEFDEIGNDVEGEFPCPECNKVFSRMSLLEKHANKHEGLKIHSCSICGKRFSRTNHLKRHMLSHSEQKPYCCDICTKSFNRRDHLMQHIKLHVRAMEYECDICKKPFGRSDHLAKHKASKHNIGEKIMGEKKFQCLVCMKNFTTEKYRDIHMKGHMGDKKFQCRTCQKTFLSKSHLTEHVKFHNENAKKFLCSECGQRFIRNDYLVIHMRRHRGEKPFKCQYCGKGFPRTTDLTVHERYHTGEKTHLCTICGRGFGRAYNLTVHMRTHTGEKPYQCTYCEAAFAQGNDLKAHVRRHTGERFQCEHCSENFLMGYLLTQHKRTVHGLNVVSNIRRLQPVVKTDRQDPDDPPITIPLPTPVIPQTVFNSQLQAHLAAAQLQQQIARQ